MYPHARPYGIEEVEAALNRDFIRLTQKRWRRDAWREAWIYWNDLKERRSVDFTIDLLENGK